MIRKTLAILLIVFGLLMLAVTMTVPMIAATGPAVVMLGAFVAAYVAWPKVRT